MARRRDDDYRFLPLVNAISAINQKVNLVGVVLETSIPRQSKGTGISLFGLNEYLPLENIRVGDHLTLICKVLHICKVQENKWMAFVWDGTDAPRANMRAKKENEIEKLPPLQLEPFPLPRDVLRKFPTIGTILRVVMENDQGLQLLNCDRRVKLINVKCEQHAGLWRCMLMPSSKHQYLSDTEKLISESQRNYEKRLTLKRGREPFSGHLPLSSIMTETCYINIPLVTLMDVINHPQVAGKFKCVVRVIAILPFQSEDFCSPQGIYRMTLTLEDATARIHAFLFAEDSEYFFDGYPSDKTLKRTRNALLGVMIPSGRSNEEQQCAQRKPPWVEFCLKSYYTDKNDKWGTRKYRIFATKVVD